MAEKKQLLQIWDNLAFARSFHSLTMALSPVRMVIAFGAVIVICFSGWLMDLAAVVGNERVAVEDAAVVNFSSSSELLPFVEDPRGTMELLEQLKESRRAQGVFATLWHFGAARFNGATVSFFKLEVANVLMNIWLCAIALLWAVKYHSIYSAIYFVIIAVVFSISGGAICRTAALEFARGEKPGVVEAVRFGIKRFKHLITAPVILTSITVSFGAGAFLIGLAGNISYAGEVIMALLFVAALVFGLLTLLFLIGSVAGVSLVFPVIAYEGTDGFDAISRSFCYVYTKPWWMLFYTAIAAVFGTISYLFVRLFVFLLLFTTWLLLDLGILSGADEVGKLERIWGKPDFFKLIGENGGPLNVTESVSSFIIYITVLLVVGLVVAFVISFYFCSSTIVYSLMRRKVDDVDMGHVYIPLEVGHEHGKTERENFT